MRIINASILCTMILFSGCLKTESSQGEKQNIPDIIRENGEVISIHGEVLPDITFPDGIYEKRSAKLEEALKNYEESPDSLENIIWFGRRLAYMGFFLESIRIYTIGLDKFPHSHELLRHRGHRYISIRKIDQAIEDLQLAAFYVRDETLKIEPDGLPNRLNKPLSNNKFNVWYHLGIAYYLKGNYDKSLSAFKACMEFCNNDDLKVANTNWMYMTYQKLGNVKAAETLLEPIHKNMRITENKAYYDLLLFYKGFSKPESMLVNAENNGVLDPTLGYGIGNWYLYNGDIEKAKEIYGKVLQNNRWDSFGFIASEAVLISIEKL